MSDRSSSAESTWESGVPVHAGSRTGLACSSFTPRLWSFRPAPFRVWVVGFAGQRSECLQKALGCAVTPGTCSDSWYSGFSFRTFGIVESSTTEQVSPCRDRHKRRCPSTRYSSASLAGTPNKAGAIRPTGPGNSQDTRRAVGQRGVNYRKWICRCGVRWRLRCQQVDVGASHAADISAECADQGVRHRRHRRQHHKKSGALGIARCTPTR